MFGEKTIAVVTYLEPYVFPQIYNIQRDKEMHVSATQLQSQ